MNTKRLLSQINFINEIDKLKTILRVNLLSDASRRENSAEHSWHLSIMVWVLAEYAKGGCLDVLRTMKMAIIHDIVEVDAGDTYALLENPKNNKESLELAAAERIFSLLPSDQAQEMWDLWREFELGQTREAKFARSIDRLNPFLQNYLSNGQTWVQNKIKLSQIERRLEEVKTSTPELWPFVQNLLDEVVAKGWVRI